MAAGHSVAGSAFALKYFSCALNIPHTSSNHVQYVPPSIDQSISNALIDHTGLVAMLVVEGGNGDSITAACEMVPFFFGCSCLAGWEALVTA